MSYMKFLVYTVGRCTALKLFSPAELAAACDCTIGSAYYFLRHKTNSAIMAEYARQSYEKYLSTNSIEDDKYEYLKAHAFD